VLILLLLHACDYYFQGVLPRAMRLFLCSVFSVRTRWRRRPRKIPIRATSNKIICIEHNHDPWHKHAHTKIVLYGRTTRCHTIKDFRVFNEHDKWTHTDAHGMAYYI
jgi:hypothetical protein